MILRIWTGHYAASIIIRSTSSGSSCYKSLFFSCSLAEVLQTNCDAGLAGRRHSRSSCLGPSSPGGSYRSVILHDLAIYLNDGTIPYHTWRMPSHSVSVPPSGHSGRAFTLNNSVKDMRSRFLKLGRNGDFNKAISLHRSSVRRDSPIGQDCSTSW